MVAYYRTGAAQLLNVADKATCEYIATVNAAVVKRFAWKLLDVPGLEEGESINLRH